MQLRRKAAILSLLAILSLPVTSGCTVDVELAPQESYEAIDPNQLSENPLEGTLVKTLDVPEENFKLIAEFGCDSASEKSWRITSDKSLYIKAYTKGLPEGTKVFIDNVHIDTSIKSKYAAMDGIKQDEMDDRIHNSLMLGFPISDNTNYFNIFAIEGCNQQFIDGSFVAYNGMGIGSIEQGRYTEEDYIVDFKVYASKFQIVFDLLILPPGVETPYAVSVKTELIVYTTENENSFKYEKVKTSLS